MSNDLSINVKSKIYEIRGKQVMLDSDLAILYECSNGTKSINLAISRNKDRFPDDFYFQLTDSEYSNLRFQIETTSIENDYGGRRYLPYVFTEQGVAMLASVLRTKVAADVSVGIMRAFVEMRKYISSGVLDLSKTLTNLDDRVTLLEESFSEFDKKEDKEIIYFERQYFRSYSKVVDIFKRAKKSLIIIDNFVDKETLDIISNLGNIKVTIITDKSTCYIKEIDIDKYNEEFSNLKVYYNKSFHDRFFIIDKKDIYHCGASVKDLGNKTFAINKIIDIDCCKLLINKINNIINKNSKEFIP